MPHTYARFVTACTALILLALCASAPAQQAPAGNSHPQTQILSDRNDASTPFGEPVFGVSPDSAAKQQFASQVNLAPLGSLAVFHNGRVKLVDTLAREIVGSIAGRKFYTEPGEPSSFRYQPLFTLLDLCIDPEYYADKPLLFVNYVHLRREFLESALPDDASAQERWMKMQRVTPLMVQNSLESILARHGSEPAYNLAIAELEQSIMLWQRGGSNFLLVAPATRDAQWMPLASLPADHPARLAAAQLGQAWRARDAAAVNSAVGTLASVLPTLSPEVYPTRKLEVEAAYNRANAFEWGFWAYFVSLLTMMLAFGTGRAWLRWTGLALLALAIGLHAFGFVSRCLIAERFAIQNQFESMTGLSLFAAVVGLTISLARKQAIFGAAAAGVGFMVLVTATQTGLPGANIEREAPILNTSVLLKYHVTTVLVSYGLISLGFIVSLFYLGSHYFAGKPADSAAIAGAGSLSGDELAAAALGHDGDRPLVGGRARLLADLDTAQMIALQLAFWTLGVGLLLGAWWADHSWGRWWAFDPKETWALLTWIIYLIVIHMRFTTGRNRGLVTAWLSVAGFVMMLWTYFGVNLLLPGLHAYA